MRASGTDPGANVRDVIPLDKGLLGVTEDGGIRAPSQEPFAAVLSCADARVPPEIVFRQALNDLFIVRVAGNVIAAEGIGSLAYAAHHLGESIKLMVVLGHTACGAVTAAVDAYLAPTNYPPITPAIGLRTIVDRIFIAVRLAPFRAA
jgi:carbonic anhydrase